MTWTLHRQQQQCGAQLPNKARQPGEARQPSQQQQGETELEQDERGEDAEQVADPQAEQAMREVSMERDAEELDEDGRLDRND